MSDALQFLGVFFLSVGVVKIVVGLIIRRRQKDRNAM